MRRRINPARTGSRIDGPPSVPEVGTGSGGRTIRDPDLMRDRVSCSVTVPLLLRIRSRWSPGARVQQTGRVGDTDPPAELTGKGVYTGSAAPEHLCYLLEPLGEPDL